MFVYGGNLLLTIMKLMGLACKYVVWKLRATANSSWIWYIATKHGLFCCGGHCKGVTYFNYLSTWSISSHISSVERQGSVFHNVPCHGSGHLGRRRFSHLMKPFKYEYHTWLVSQVWSHTCRSSTSIVVDILLCVSIYLCIHQYSHQYTGPACIGSNSH